MQRLTVYLWVLLLLAGDPLMGFVCAQPGKPIEEVAKPAAPKAVVFATPEECFAAFQKSAVANSKEAQLACMSTALSNYLTGVMALQLQRSMFTDEAFKAESAAVEKVLIKHGYKDKDIMGYLQVVDSPRPGGAIPGFMQIGDVVKDKLSFFNEAEAALKAIQKKAAAGDDDAPAADKPAVKPPADEKDKPVPPQPKLADLRVTDSTASANTVAEDGSKQPIYFVKEQGSWKIATGEKEPDWKAPIQGRFLFQEDKK